MTTCRIGFVGAGGVAARHARMLAGFTETELVAVTDPDGDRAASFASSFGARAVPDVEALLNERPDAVYVCVPPSAHGAAEKAVVAAGLAMFVEKPIAVDLETAEAIAATVAEAGIVTAVGHHWRYSAAVQRAQRLLAGRPVRLVGGSWLDKVPPVAWWASRASSGGQVVEQAVHVLDLARLLAGEVTEVYALADGVPPIVDDTPGADVDGATVAVLRFASGAVGTLAATCRLGWKHRAGIELVADGLALALSEETLEVTEERGALPVQAVEPDEARRAADRSFVDAVVGDRGSPAGPVLVPYAEALRTHRLACAIASSVAQGAPVRIEPPRTETDDREEQGSAD